MIALWECRCGNQTVIPELDLPRIQVHQTGMPTDVLYVNFVCPQCGLGTRRSLRDIPRRSVRGPIRYRLHLFHADLRCVGQRCDSHATVHTLAESDKPNAGPKIAVRSWTLVGICCYAGHPVKVPLELRRSRVTAG